MVKTRRRTSLPAQRPTPEGLTLEGLVLEGLMLGGLTLEGLTPTPRPGNRITVNSAPENLP